MSPPPAMELVVAPDGLARCVYAEHIDLSALGASSIARASHVEPDPAGRWWADLAPVGGPRLGPFDHRSQALAAESAWLARHWLRAPLPPPPVPSAAPPTTAPLPTTTAMNPTSNPETHALHCVCLDRPLRDPRIGRLPRPRLCRAQCQQPPHPQHRLHQRHQHRLPQHTLRSPRHECPLHQHPKPYPCPRSGRP